MYLKELQQMVLNETTMKMKLFVYSHLDNVEKEINDWLDQRHRKVCHIQQSQSEKQGRFVFVISVFYTEAD